MLNPTKKSEITKTFMLAYIKENGTAKDKEWFKKIITENIVEKENHLKKNEKMKGLELKKIRAAFIDRFFPALNENAPKTIAEYLDEVNAL